MATVTPITLTSVIDIFAMQFTTPGFNPTTVDNSLRIFCSKFSASLSANVVEHSLESLTISIVQIGNGDYRAVDSITDNLTSAVRAEFSQTSRSTIINNISSDIEVALNNDAPGSAHIEGATAALRDFMVKFGPTTSIDAVEDTLAILAWSIQNSNTGDYRAIDAITDNLTAEQLALMDQFTREGIVLSLANDVADFLYNNELAKADAATAALRDFMEKVGSTTDITNVENTLAILAWNIDNSNTGDYRAFDAITDNLTAEQLALMNQFVRQDVISSITNDIGDHLVNNNSDALDSTTAALRDFMSKVGSTTSEGAIEFALADLANARYGEGLAAILENISDAQVSELLENPYVADTFAQRNVHVLTDGRQVQTFGSTDDIIIARDGNDTIRAGAGNDQVLGGEGSDILYGDAGNDYLSGGIGTDVLWGGTGADTFALDLQGGAVDNVRDFSVSQGDKLDLSALIDGFDPVTDAITDFIRITSTPNGGKVYVDADGVGGNSAVLVSNITLVDGTLDVQTLYDNGQIIV